MKKLNVLSTLLLLMVLVSCAGGGKMEFDSPDQYTHITVSAESASMPMDPLQITVAVRSPAFTRELNFEAMMSNLSEATCSLKWVDGQKAELRLMERDETSRLIEIISDSTQLKIRLVDANE